MCAVFGTGAISSNRNLAHGSLLALLHPQYHIGPQGPGRVIGRIIPWIDFHLQNPQ
jgi:hypothetical protein